MEGQAAFNKYLALKLHFTSPSYDYFKYNGKTRPILLDKRKDAMWFARLERKYKEPELINYYVSNMISNQRMNWIGDFNEVNYINWKKRNESFSYLFKTELSSLLDTTNLNDILKSDSGNHPMLLRAYMGNRVSIDTVVAMNKILQFICIWDQRIQDNVVWPSISNIFKKYDPFTKYDIGVIKKTLREVIDGTTT